MSDRLVFSIRDIAEAFGVSYPTAKDWVYKGKLKSFKIGGLRRVRREELERFIDAHAAQGDRGHA